MQANYTQDSITLTLEEGSRAYPIREDGSCSFAHVCTFTDGMEDVPVVDEDRYTFIIKVGDEEMLVCKPQMQSTIDRTQAQIDDPATFSH